MKKKIAGFLVPCFLFVTLSMVGQNRSIDSLYSWFDNQIGTINSGLYASTEFVEEYQVINDKHRFFNSPNYLYGSLWIEDHPFHHVLMKYDLFQDQLIVSPSDISGVPPLKIANTRIDSFRIRKQKFVKKDIVNDQSNEAIGFYEVLVNSQYYTLLKKYRKTDIRKLNRNRVYYEFKEKNEYILEYNQEYYDIKKHKDVLDILPIPKDVQKRLLTRTKARNLTDGSIRALLREVSSHLDRTDTLDDS